MWLHSDCVELISTWGFSSVGQLLASSLLGRPEFVMTLSSVGPCSLVARRVTSSDFPNLPLFGLQLALLETALACVSKKVMRSGAQATVAAMSASSSEGAIRSCSTSRVMPWSTLTRA